MHAVRENVKYRTRNGDEVVLTSLDPRNEQQARVFDEGYRFYANVDSVDIPFTAVGRTQPTHLGDNALISPYDLMEIITE